MKKLCSVLTEISELINNIVSDYTELSRFLDENPLTLPHVIAHTNVDKKPLGIIAKSATAIEASQGYTNREPYNAMNMGYSNIGTIGNPVLQI